MTTPFYTDALKAAWQAREHGFRFMRPDDDLIADWDDMVDFLSECIATDIWDLRLTIHPDSLALLEPQVGDLVEATFHKSKLSRVDWIIHFVDGEPICKGGYHATNIIRILQRNSKAFFAPEVA